MYRGAITHRPMYNITMLGDPHGRMPKEHHCQTI